MLIYQRLRDIENHRKPNACNASETKTLDVCQQLGKPWVPQGTSVDGHVGGSSWWLISFKKRCTWYTYTYIYIYMYIIYKQGFLHYKSSLHTILSEMTVLVELTRVYIAIFAWKTTPAVMDHRLSPQITEDYPLVVESANGECRVCRWISYIFLLKNLVISTTASHHQRANPHDFWIRNKVMIDNLQYVFLD